MPVNSGLGDNVHIFYSSAEPISSRFTCRRSDLSPPFPYSQQGKYLSNERLMQSEQCGISSPFLISPELLGSYFSFCVLLLKHLGIWSFNISNFKPWISEQA